MGGWLSTFVLATHRYKLIRIPWGPPHLAEMNPSQPEASQVVMNWPDLWTSSVSCHRVFVLRRVLPLDQRGKLGTPCVLCSPAGPQASAVSKLAQGTPENGREYDDICPWRLGILS